MLEIIHRFLDIPYKLKTFRYGDWDNEDRPVIILLHGIGANHRVWLKLINKLDDYPILAIDLLGFGKSRKPKTADYSLRDQALALAKTLRSEIGRNRNIILCGHSLGSLVSLEYAKRFPARIEKLFLCSPPIYDMSNKGNFPSREALLEQVGKRFLNAIESEDRSIINIANTYRVQQKNYRIDPNNVSPFVKTARRAIMNQTALRDIEKIELPIRIVYGTLDTVMIPVNFRRARKLNPNIKISSVASGHEMNALYMGKIAKLINPNFDSKRPIMKKLSSFRKKQK